MKISFGFTTWFLFFVVGPITLAGMRLSFPPQVSTMEMVVSLIQKTIPAVVYGHLMLGEIWVGGSLYQAIIARQSPIWLLASGFWL